MFLIVMISMITTLMLFFTRYLVTISFFLNYPPFIRVIVLVRRMVTM